MEAEQEPQPAALPDEKFPRLSEAAGATRLWVAVLGWRVGFFVGYFVQYYLSSCPSAEQMVICLPQLPNENLPVCRDGFQ